VSNGEHVANSGNGGSPLPPFPFETASFLRALAGSAGMNTVAAITGGYKTFFGLNLLAAQLLDGTKVGLLNLDMQQQRVLVRLLGILAGIPYAELRTKAEAFCQPSATVAKEWIRDGLVCSDLSMLKRTPDNILACAERLVHKGCRLILVDGFDKLHTIQEVRFAAGSLASNLSDLGKNTGASIWITSQVQRETEDLEIPSVTNVSEAMGKADRASVVVFLATRVSNALLTASVVKDRDGIAKGRRIIRLVVRPSLRIEVLSAPGDITQHPSSLPDAPTCIHVQEGDLPDQEGEYSEGVAESASMPNLSTDQPLGCAISNPDAFVQITRRLQASAMYQNRRYEHVFWLLDLAFGAAFQDGWAVYAPNTNTPVTLRRGQIMISRRERARRWGTTKEKVDTFLQAACREGLIEAEHVLTDGARRPAYVPASAPTNAPTNAPTEKRRRKAVCTVITLLFYHCGKDQHAGSAQSEPIPAPTEAPTSRQQCANPTP